MARGSVMPVSGSEDGPVTRLAVTLLAGVLAWPVVAGEAASPEAEGVGAVEAALAPVPGRIEALRVRALRVDIAGGRFEVDVEVDVTGSVFYPMSLGCRVVDPATGGTVGRVTGGVERVRAGTQPVLLAGLMRRDFAEAGGQRLLTAECKAYFY